MLCGLTFPAHQRLFLGHNSLRHRSCPAVERLFHIREQLLLRVGIWLCKRSSVQGAEIVETCTFHSSTPNMERFPYAA